MAVIHPTAIVASKANLAASVKVGAYTIIGPDVSVGPDTTIGPRVYIASGTTIGRNCQIHLGAVIGHEPQMLKTNANQGRLVIGDNTIVREYCTIHRSTRSGQSTLIGSGNFLMAFSHVAHDCRLADQIVLCNGSLLAGHVQVDDHAFISGNVTVHQFVRIGRYAMVGGLSRVNKDIPPYMLVKGDSEIWALNSVGLKRGGFSNAARRALKEAFRVIFKSGHNLKQAIEILQQHAASAEIEELINFIRHSPRGICAYHRNRLHIGFPFKRKPILGYHFFSLKSQKK